MTMGFTNHLVTGGPHIVSIINIHMGMGQNPGAPGEPQNSWDLWMFIPLKMVLIGIDPYPYPLWIMDG